MQELYSEQMYQSVAGKLRRRHIILFTVLLILLGIFAFFVFSFNKWAAMAVAGAAGFFAVFYLDLLCRPLSRYRRLVSAALHGRSHVRDLEFARAEPDLSSVDGVSCRGLIFLGDADKHGSREMLLYWDNELPLPELVPGETVTVKYTDKYVIGLHREGLSSRP